MFATQLYLTIYRKSFFEYFTQGACVIVITILLFVFAPGWGLTKFMVHPSLSYIVFWAFQAINIRIALTKIMTIEKKMAEEKSASNLQRKTSDVVKALQTNQYVEQKCKS